MSYAIYDKDGKRISDARKNQELAWEEFLEECDIDFYVAGYAECEIAKSDGYTCKEVVVIERDVYEEVARHIDILYGGGNIPWAQKFLRAGEA